MSNFTYLGYDSSRLESLCSEDNVKKGFAKWYYWPFEVYSFGKHFRSYAYYPSFLPLMGYSCHGVPITHYPIAPHEQNSTAPFQFYFSPEIVEEFQKINNKPCYCVLAPFVWYRRKKGVIQSQSAKGTLVFPSHSTPSIDVVQDLSKYINKIKMLPEKFQPVCVMLHMHDINAGQHHAFIKEGIPVYTAGNALDQRFAERFYSIMRNFKYTSSNILGSYVAYSIEMSIPFFLMGEPPKFYNVSDPNKPKGYYLYRRKEYISVERMFEKVMDTVSKEQLLYIEKKMGVYDSISRFKMAKILYKSYLKNGSPFKDIAFAINEMFKQKMPFLKKVLKKIYGIYR